MGSKRSQLLPAAVAGILLAAGAIGDDDETSAVAPARRGAPLSVRALYERARNGVVLVDARRPGVRPRTGPPRRGDGVATGSGFVIDERGHVVTNDHVVAGRSVVAIGFRGRDRDVRAKVVGRDPSTDLALLRVDPDEAGDLAPIPLGDSDRVRVGDTAIAIGNPFGLERTLTTGVVSGTDRDIDAPNGFAIGDAVQTDAAIASGSSGGPLLDDAGRVIGVNSQSRRDGEGGGAGIGLAVPVDTVKDVVPQLRRHGEVKRAYLGVSTTAARRGARVVDVVDGGPADDAGVRQGDVIVELGGRDVRSPGDVADAVTERRPGRRVELVVVRGARRTALRARLGER